MKGITFLTSEITNSPNNPIFDFIQKLNEGLFGMITTLISNIGVILPIILFFVLLICFLGTFKSKTKRISKLLLYEFIKNKKYIEGLFVELNNTKEYLRYFIYGKKWKIRIIHKYNALFNDEYGKHLKLIFGDKINLTLNKHQNLTRISDIISETLDLIQKVNSRQIQCSEEFRDTEILFEIHGRHYIERLNELKLYIEFSKKRSIVLTGSAGNGKTNILCNFVEMLINKKDICIFLNSSNVEDDIENYFRNQLSTLNLTKNKWFDIFWIIENIICFIRRKYIYIVIDAINENGNEEFYKSLPKFINKILKYPMVKIITSCRSEYFDLKFRKVLIEQINYPVLCYDILQGTYSSVAKERLYDNYCKAFNFNGTVAQEVKEKLFNQLLLMRMFLK